MKKGLVYLLALFTCFAVVGCDKKDNKKENEKENTGVVTTLNNDSKELKLETDHEEFKINDLTLKFFGEDASKDTNVDKSYKYVLSIDLNGVGISSNIYSNPDKRIINSTNLNSTFTLYAIEDIYVLKSTTGAKKDGENILVIDKSGNFIESFEDISANVSVKDKKINYTNCITDDENEVCDTRVYEISKNTITRK